MAARRPILFVAARATARTTAGIVRRIHIQATPATTSLDGPVDLAAATQAIPKLSGTGPFPADVRFEVLGAPYSLLSVALPASSLLYSRRGTVVGINGVAENVVSKLSILSPLRRAALRIPFLYQKITSTTPLTALIATNAPHTTFGVIQLDGTTDWTLTQPSALLAWTGHSLTSMPTLSRTPTPGVWGSTRLTGRGLVAVVGRGALYQLVLRKGEEFMVRPGSLVAYSRGGKGVGVVRLKGGGVRLQVPEMGWVGGWLRGWGVLGWLREWQAWRGVESVGRALGRALFEVRAWGRRWLWGEEVFLRFEGPVTVLLQSRTAQVAEVLRSEDVDEGALMAPGVRGVTEDITDDVVIATGPPGRSAVGTAPKALKVAIVSNGKLEFQDSDFGAFVQKKK